MDKRSIVFGVVLLVSILGSGLVMNGCDAFGPTGTTMIVRATTTSTSSTTITSSTTPSTATSTSTTTTTNPSVATFNVTYDGTGSTGGSVPIDSNTYVTGATVEVQGNTGNLITIRGSTFEGWNTAPNGGGTKYIEGQIFIMGSANITLYAMWKPIYALGSHGEAGIVFYDRGSYTTGLTPDWRYMEYAPVDQSTQEAWWDITTEVAVSTDTRMEYGKANTAAIVAVSAASAAKLCANYSVGGKTDWFLPSADEFNQISFVSSTYSIPADRIASPGVYWTSSYRIWDGGGNSAWLNGLLPGDADWDYTNHKYRVRAAREF